MYENLIKLLTLYINPGPRTWCPRAGWRSIRAADQPTRRVYACSYWLNVVTGIKLQVAEAVSQVSDAVSADTSIADRLRAVNLESQAGEQVLGNHFLREGSTLGENSSLGMLYSRCLRLVLTQTLIARGATNLVKETCSDRLDEVW